jgi:hypothetical protein
MCRHTVGLNWTAFGIEHVGRSDAQILHNHAQLQASLRLVRWLQGRYGIETKNVIGPQRVAYEPVPPRARQGAADTRRTAISSSAT